MGYITISLKMTDKMGKTTLQEGKAIIKDGVSLTAYNNPKQTELTFKAMKKAGRKCEMKDGVLVERYDKMKAQEIANKIERDINDMAKKFEKIMNVNYSIKITK